MTYKVYIESLNNFPIADWGVYAYLGFKQGQTTCIFFEDVEEVPTSPYNIIVACIETTNKYLARWGMEPKKALNIPNELYKYKYLGRRVTYATMGEVRKESNIAFPVFIKPNGRAKEFVAGVVKGYDMVPFFFKDVKDDVEVLLSTPVDFVSEYRTYVCEGKILGLYWYIGDNLIFPDPRIIQEMIKEYKSSPIAYSLDVGVTREGKTLLIECNDAWSLGNYGLECTKYAQMLAKRWRELMKEAIHGGVKV